MHLFIFILLILPPSTSQSTSSRRLCLLGALFIAHFPSGSYLCIFLKRSVAAVASPTSYFRCCLIFRLFDRVELVFAFALVPGVLFFIFFFRTFWKCRCVCYCENVRGVLVSRRYIIPRPAGHAFINFPFVTSFPGSPSPPSLVFSRFSVFFFFSICTVLFCDFLCTHAVFFLPILFVGLFDVVHFVVGAMAAP